MLDGPIPSETCHCPRPIANFVEDFQCSSSDPAGQIARDMSIFPDGVTREMMDEAIITLNKNDTSLVHFVIKVIQSIAQAANLVGRRCSACDNFYYLFMAL
jgi:hypothetical protein